MIAVSTPRDLPPRLRRRATHVRVASLALATVAFAGIIITTPGALPTSAEAAAATDSAITVKWTGDTSSASRFQPTRDATSAHFIEFDELAVTVSQTSGITDQAIQVSVTGFGQEGKRGTITTPDNSIQNAMNYLQAMQCWGDPAAANFRETCQWGGRYVENNGLANSIYFDNTLRVASIDLDPSTTPSFDVPFLTEQGKSVAGKPGLIDPDGAGPLAAEQKYQILDYFNAATTNEVNSARVGADGSGYFDFETQTADQAPQLGCGTSARLRCWLVVVPRGTVFGGNGNECSSYAEAVGLEEAYTKGRPDSVQGGSPINPHCDYWENRVVVPLDFRPVGSTCTIGSAEERVVGSQLMVGAMSSWQPDLCSKLATTYSFATNPDAIARNRILEGSSTMAFAGFPLSPGELTTNDARTKLAETKIVYAPVATSGVVIAFLAELSNGRETMLNLSPRLVAKILTQSYRFTVPANSAEPDKNLAHLPANNLTIRYLNQDPEFQALNPTNYGAFTENPGIVLPGPSGADAIRQVWRWIIADKDAAAFLAGQPDASGMTINPYYLPKGSPGAKVPTFDDSGNYVLDAAGSRVMRDVGLTNIDGTPFTLSTSTLDTFIKADESKVPLKLTNERTRFDSLQFAPFTDNLLSAARAAFRANPNSKTVWDNAKINASGQMGDWVSSGAQVPGQKFMIAITDSPSAARYGLDTAALVVPNSTTAVAANEAGFAAALTALTPTNVDAVTQVDPTKVTGTGYPLTIVTYAEVNLTVSSATSRKNIAAMLGQVTTTGQVRGTAPGQLPDGYLPLTTAMVAQAASAVTEITRFTPSDASTNGIAQDAYEGSSTFGGDSSIADTGAADPSHTEGVDTASDARTASSVGEPFTRAGLGISLGVGLSGALFAPYLFRRRGLI